jgi:4-aminobutyrate aminotransferase/(S)-3-amino-2-methylpropionate transaminase
LVCLGKSLSAELPLSAVTGKKEIMDSPPLGSLGGTYGGNPVVCSVTLAVLEIFGKLDLLEASKRIGSVLEQHLEKWKEHYEVVGDVRGMGAMRAIELVEDRKTKKPATEETTSLF